MAFAEMIERQPKRRFPFSLSLLHSVLFGLQSLCFFFYSSLFLSLSIYIYLFISLSLSLLALSARLSARKPFPLSQRMSNTRHPLGGRSSWKLPRAERSPCARHPPRFDTTSSSSSAAVGTICRSHQRKHYKQQKHNSKRRVKFAARLGTWSPW